MIEESKHLGYPDKALVAAVKTLEDLGYVNCGGNRWVAPAELATDALKERITDLEKEVEELNWELSDKLEALEMLREEIVALVRKA